MVLFSNKFFNKGLSIFVHRQLVYRTDQRSASGMVSSMDRLTTAFKPWLVSMGSEGALARNFLRIDETAGFCAIKAEN